MDNITSAQKKLTSFLKRRDPKLTEKDIAITLTGVKRFVNLARKIYTEPQAQVTYKDRKIGKKTQKDRIFTTDMKELTKVMKKPAEPIEEVFRKFHKSVTNNEKK